MLEQARDEHRLLPEVERQSLHATHAEMGAYLLGIWSLPCTVVEAVANHHAPSRVSHPKLDAVAAVHIANALVREMDDSSLAVHEVPGALNQEYLDALGVSD